MRLLIGGVRRKRSQQHHTLGKLRVKAVDRQNAVHAVHAEENGLVAVGVRLIQDCGGRRAVDGQEHKIGAFVLRVVKLHGVVNGVGVAAHLGNDIQAEDLRLIDEVLINAVGVGAGVIVDHGDLGVGHMLVDVLRRGAALIGVGEADLEHIVLARGDLG